MVRTTCEWLATQYHVELVVVTLTVPVHSDQDLINPCAQVLREHGADIKVFKQMNDFFERICSKSFYNQRMEKKCIISNPLENLRQ